MECLNKLLRKVKSGMIIALMLMMCITTMPSFATEATEPITEEPPASTGEETEVTNLPHIDMKVKQVKVGDSNQVLVECWASKINNLAEIDITFTYDKTILQPSYINGDNTNQTLEGIDTIKWETRPDVIDPSTHLSIEQERDYMNRNKALLSNSFEFKNEYGNYLNIFVFQYLATNENNEALQFVVRNETVDDIPNIETEVLIGTFSFRKISDASLEGTFSTKYIAITSDNNEEGWDIRDITGTYGDTNCEELVEFVYEKFGSISGTVDLGDDAKRNQAKTIATIKVFEKSKVSEIIDWNDLDTYKAKRLNLPEPDYCYDKMKEEDQGSFKIENIIKGEYIVLIDKKNFLDYVITGVVIEGTNDNVNLDEILEDLEEKIILYPGDMDKNGKVEVLDRNTVNKAYGDNDQEDTYDINDNGKVEVLDRNIINKAYNDRSINGLMKVINLTNN